MKLIDTSNLGDALGRTESLYIYNGLDCCVTHEVYDVIHRMLDETTTKTYEFSKALQAPILEMNMRGVLIDQVEKGRLIGQYTTEAARVKEQFEYLCREGLSIDVKIGSPHDIKRLFYDVMRIPPVKKKDANGIFKPTVNREALEKLTAYFYTQPFISHILLYRDLQKKIGFLKTGIDPDGRLRTSFNIAGTNTGRLASNFSDFGTGTNLQNVERRLRRIIVADPGYKFCNIDLEQGDSRNLGFLLGYLFDDWSYLDACESGDLHTTVAKMAWPELPWTGDPLEDRKIADGIAYREYSYRDLSKKLGHGSNYRGKPATMAKHAKILIATAANFQKGYFAGFPAIPRFHDWVFEQLRTTHSLTTPFGRRRYFFGRVGDDPVWNEAVAYMPQSMTADEIDTIMLRVWEANIVQILLQVHDSLLFQYREEDESWIIPKLLDLAKVSLEHRGRTFTISSEAKVGWNWADVEYNKDGTVKDNPHGLIKWKGSDSRTRPSAPASILDRVLS